jgi:hypothetical protein
MKRNLSLALAVSFLLSACALPFPQVAPAPATPIDLAATANVFVQQTLLAQPSPTSNPSKTPVVTTPSLTIPPPTATGSATETQNPDLLTLTATLGTGTVQASTSAITATGTLLSATPTGTQNPSIGATPTQTLHPRFYGTVPPDKPFGKITLSNKAKAEAYISLQCEDRDGKVTILEYPVRGQFDVKAPAGSYLFVAWVGGRKMTGTFHLGSNNDITIKLYRNKVVVSGN